MKELPLRNNKGIAFVDDELYDLLTQWKWYLDNDGYAIRADRTATIRMHRFIMNAPPGLQVDHINHIRLDNQRANLRICTLAENRRNQSRSHGKSQYRGVQLTPSGAWRADIKVNGKKIYIGRFATEIEAARVRDQFAREHHGDFAILNFP